MKLRICYIYPCKLLVVSFPIFSCCVFVTFHVVLLKCSFQRFFFSIVEEFITYWNYFILFFTFRVISSCIWTHLAHAVS